jgi:hypothetical protein
MRHGEAGSVLSRLAEHTVAVDAHPAFLWYWNVAVRAAVPAFAYLAINKPGVGVDVEANLPPRRGYTHKLRPVWVALTSRCASMVASPSKRTGHLALVPSRGDCQTLG